MINYTGNNIEHVIGLQSVTSSDQCQGLTRPDNHAGDSKQLKYTIVTYCK